MRHRCGRRAPLLAPLLLLTSGLLPAPRAAAQDAARDREVEVGGTAYVDAFYNVSAPDEDDEELNGFTYRRLYLTADFTLSDAFEGRARLEANNGTTGDKGPVPFVKDLYLRWTSAAEHRITAGVQPPPAFDLSEDVWDYRSLEKTTLDLFGIVESRDFGVRADGPLAADGRLRYHAMIANNEAVKPEDDRHKRVYALLEARPSDPLVFTAGADYATYPDERDGALRLTVFGAYIADALSVGVEAFRYGVRYAAAPEGEVLGVSVFGRAAVASGWEVVGRVDRVGAERHPTLGSDRYTFALAGVAYAPVRGVRLIPNLHLMKEDGADAALTARATIDVEF